jgi:chlorobactene glucosyltransferase
MLLAILLLCLVLVLWNVLAWGMVRPAAHDPGPVVSVLIPAREEESNIRECLDSIRDQAGILEVVVYDDHSSDRTREFVEEAAARDRRIRLARTESLPPGWCGKPFACSRLAAEARGEWLLFLDADARLSAGAIGGILGEARRRGVTMLSCWPSLEMRTFAERLLMPLLNFVVFTMYPAPLAVWRRDPCLGIAHGVCILCRRQTYETIGGHAAVASEIFEDTRLAQVWRERGSQSLCLDGQHVVRARMYATAGEIWSGFRKNFRAGFRTEAAFWSFWFGHALLFFGVFFFDWRAAAVVVLIRFLLAARFGQPLWSAILHPVGECFLLALGLASWRARKSGRGVSWKGRQYRPV